MSLVELLGHERLRYKSYVVIGIYSYKIKGLWVQGVLGLKGYKAMGSRVYEIQYIKYNGLIGLGV